ncbi:hypothetical protein AKJ62_04045 [candidate division MSBL1 archaeon SCGC-AAA259D14]|uniref:Uncharacterized protein n=1 Tax=candidate division MSBL1 archaeon SCGC-AAA259D14 TaxID=1698261 RepID=A0A133U472_9EURY|nr:hypothetical protein AKJ62_04045 [candidate division MSBL1 archaeon SCGC-AAA259D14]
MKINDLRRRLIRLTRRTNETCGWLGIMDELGRISLKEKNPQKASAIRNELDRRFYSACRDREALFQKFFEGEMEVESSWKNQDKVVESIARVVTWQLSRLRDSKVTEEEWKKIREESERVFLYTKVFGPMEIPGEDKHARTVYKTGEFLEWAEEAIDAADFQGMWKYIGKTIVPLASEEAVSTPNLQPEGLVRNGAPETVGFSDADSLVYTVVSRCNQCGRKFLSLGVGVPPECPCKSEGDSTSGDETVYPLAQRVVNYPMFDPLDLEDSFHTGEIWRASQKEAREIIAWCRTPSNCASKRTFNRYGGGILLSIFAGLLCIASGTKTTPSNIARAATDGEYRNLLLEEAKGNSMRVANRLKKRENIRRIAVAFWS